MEKQKRKQVIKETDWEESSGNVFADLEFDQPEEILARAKLLRSVNTLIRNSKLSEKEVAKQLGITQKKSFHAFNR